MDLHPDHQSYDACSAYVPEDSNPSLLYTTSKKFLTEQSKHYGLGMSGVVDPNSENLGKIYGHKSCNRRRMDGDDEEE